MTTITYLIRLDVASNSGPFWLIVSGQSSSKVELGNLANHLRSAALAGEGLAAA